MILHHTEAVVVKSPHLLCVDSVKKRSSEGLEVVRMELEERENLCDELHSIQLWIEDADVLLNEMGQGRNTGGLQVRQSSTIVTSCFLLIVINYLCKQTKCWIGRSCLLLQQKL